MQLQRASDGLLIRTYDITVTNAPIATPTPTPTPTPTSTATPTPSPTPTPTPTVGTAASLAPDPSGVSFTPDGSWRTFTVNAAEQVKVVANPPGTDLRVEITSSSSAGNHCSNGAERGDNQRRSNGQTVYLAG